MSFLELAVGDLRSLGIRDLGSPDEERSGSHPSSPGVTLPGLALGQPWSGG